MPGLLQANPNQQGQAQAVPMLPSSGQPLSNLQQMVQARAAPLDAQTAMIQALKQRAAQGGMQMQSTNPYLKKMWGG
jgi:hypothetical protein